MIEERSDKWYMFTFRGRVYSLPPCDDLMRLLLNGIEEIFLCECKMTYYRTIERINVLFWMVDEERELNYFNTIIQLGPTLARKGRGESILDMTCYFPKKFWLEMSDDERRQGIADYMVDCKIAARRWLDKRKEILYSDLFEADFARALDKFRRGGGE